MNPSVSQVTLVLALVVAPSLLLIAGLIYLRRAGNRPELQKYYEVDVFGHRFMGTRSAMLQLLMLSVLFWWLDWFLPFSFALVIFAVGIMAFARTRQLSSTATTEETQKFLSSLSSMQREITAVKDHVEILGRNVALAQSELDTKEELKRQLEAIIQAKEDEAKGWTQMTDGQRKAFVETAVSAMSKESRGTFWWGLFLGFLINLLATGTWALLGNPGQVEILSKLRVLGNSVGVNVSPPATMPGGPASGGM